MTRELYADLLRRSYKLTGDKPVTIEAFDNDDINLSNDGETKMSIQHFYTVTATVEMNIAAETIEDGRDAAADILSDIVTQHDGKFIVHSTDYNKEMTDKENW